MARTLSSVGCIPLADIWCPRYSTDNIMNVHLLRFRRRPAVCNLDNTASRLARWLSCVFPVTSTSSK